MTFKTRSLTALLMTSAALVAVASNEQPGVTKMPDAATGRTTTYVCQTANHRNLAAKRPTQEYDKPGVCPVDGMRNQIPDVAPHEPRLLRHRLHARCARDADPNGEPVGLRAARPHAWQARPPDSAVCGSSMPATTREEIARLTKALRATAAARGPDSLGGGPLALCITGVRQLTPRVRAHELRSPEGADLPAVRAESHIDVPVQLQKGSLSTRRYSIAPDPGQRSVYEIAVLREDEGSGGSVAAHTGFQLGMVLRCGLPAMTSRFMKTIDRVLSTPGRGVRPTGSGP